MVDFDAERWGGRIERSVALGTRGWRCATCGAELGVATPLPFRCPNATRDDPRHVLHIVPSGVAGRPPGIHHPFLNFDHDLAWAGYAAAHGIDLLGRLAIVAELDDAIRRVDDVGFVVTPFARSDVLSDELGFAPAGGIWVKDETGGVAGSHKARFLFAILLHLRAAEELGHLTERPPLAIASCGNAALAAAVLAQAAGWPLDVYVPTWMSDTVGERLDALGASIHRCPRRDDDPAGDPALLRFRDAVVAGAIPFTVQGPENALCLDGGRTIGWEIGCQLEAAGLDGLDRVFIQVGGGALASALSTGLGMKWAQPVALHAVQAEGCAPLARAWELVKGVDDPARMWAAAMTPWDDPVSVADGILDDETYDWVGVANEMRRTGGGTVVAPETAIVEAHVLAQRAGFDVSATGSAGLAGVLTSRDAISPSERIAVVMSGVAR
ncbi:MAG: PLP-dependent lyase/thiolase [Ilumatobacter sp.]|nr:PLP-dependent lyase/thiolase [Ilumatobacter sp.]